MEQQTFRVHARAYERITCAMTSEASAKVIVSKVFRNKMETRVISFLPRNEFSISLLARLHTVGSSENDVRKSSLTEQFPHPSREHGWAFHSRRQFRILLLGMLEEKEGYFVNSP
jgi:hypothetical protein